MRVEPQRIALAPPRGARTIIACTVLLLVLLTAGLALAGEPTESLARVVPAGVGLYVEGHHVDDLLLPLTDLQVWAALAELAGQPADVAETTEWRNRVRQAVRMDPAEALHVLLSDQFAFVAEGPGRAEDAVLVCRPIVDGKVLLDRWQAQPRPTAGRTSLYRLPSRIGVARPDGLLMFGDDSPSNGMFQRMLEFTDAGHGATLADDPIYKSLIARVPERPDAVLFARFDRGRKATPMPVTAPASSAPATASAPTEALLELPGPLRGAASILLALHRGDGLLRFSAVGYAVSPRPRTPNGLNLLVERLPERTLAAWGVLLNYPGLLRAMGGLPANSLPRIALRLQGDSGTVERLAGALDEATCVAVGVVEPARRTVTAPPIPAVAVLIATRQAETVATEMEALLRTTASICNLIALQIGSPLAPPIEQSSLNGVQVTRLDLSELVRQQPGGAAIGELHLCWAIDGDVLIVASHSDWLRQILAARHGTAPTLGGLVGLSARPVAAHAETVIALQPGPSADLGALWLKYLEQVAPQTLETSWWRAHQPGGDRIQLGIQVTEEPDLRRLRVTSVTANTPADHMLKAGDVITGCGGRPFATSQPVREMRTAIAQRPNARWLDIDVERDGTTRRRRIALPFVDPIQMLRRAIAVGKIVQRVVYHDDVDENACARGVLTVELRKPELPSLFPFSPIPAATPPLAPGAATSAPSATQPVPASTPAIP